jgi:uncharacterized protein
MKDPTYIVTAPRAEQERRMTICVRPSGRLVNPFEMKASDLEITDIAHHLAHINRYTGATPEPYNVAHHSVLVSREFINRDLRLAGLLHDAAEYVLNDIASPVKRHPAMAGYVAALDKLDVLIFETFGLDPELLKVVKPADDALFHRETASFWGSIEPSKRIRPLPAAESRRLFLAEFRALGGRSLLEVA